MRDRLIKRLLGCAVVVILLAVAVAVLGGVNWGAISGGGDSPPEGEKTQLAKALHSELGQLPRVEFTCRLPVVGEAPCPPGGSAGTREVVITFEDYPLPARVDIQVHAAEIAETACRASAFVKEADQTKVVFFEGDDVASVLRRYSFASDSAGDCGSTRPARATNW